MAIKPTPGWIRRRRTLVHPRGAPFSKLRRSSDLPHHATQLDLSNIFTHRTQLFLAARDGLSRVEPRHKQLIVTPMMPSQAYALCALSTFLTTACTVVFRPLVFLSFSNYYTCAIPTYFYKWGSMGASHPPPSIADTPGPRGGARTTNLQRGCNLRVGCFFGNYPHVDGISSTCRTTSPSSLILPSAPLVPSATFLTLQACSVHLYLFARGFLPNLSSASGVGRILSFLEASATTLLLLSIHITRKEAGSVRLPLQPQLRFLD